MPEELLSTVEVEPTVEARFAVIWLHGLGADGHDFEPLVPYFDLPPEAGVRFVFPHAPSIPITINGGWVMPGWYDITDMALERRHDLDGLKRSSEQLRALIRRENERGIPSERIVLAGFSQGGAVALHTAPRYEERLAGLLILSTYLMGDTLEAERSEANRDLPVFQAHGTADPMVPIAGGEAARDELLRLGYAVDWHTYPIQHEVSPLEITHIGQWLRDTVSHTV